MGQKEVQKLKALQGKWWYRFVKVIFVIAVAFLFIIGAVDIIESSYPETYQELDREGTIITCLNGNENSFSLTDASNSVGRYLTEDDLQVLSISTASGEITYDDHLTNEYAEKLCDLVGSSLVGVRMIGSSQVQDEPVPSPKYSINKVYNEVKEGSYSLFILYIFLWVLGCGLVEELVRRVFYYIVLGKFFPKQGWF